MNDRFKFRVWDKENEVWVDEEDCSIAPNGDLTVLGLDSYGETNFRETDDCIVEQCTGLKDKNGKLIYEGDIVKFENEISEVKWCINGFAIDDGIQYLVDDMDIEVIGNIHENSELLEEKAE